MKKYQRKKNSIGFMKHNISKTNRRKQIHTKSHIDQEPQNGGNKELWNVKIVIVNINYQNYINRKDKVQSFMVNVLFIT